MTTFRGFAIAAAALALLFTVAACGGYGDDNESEGGSTTIAGMQAEVHGTKDVSGETKAEVEMYDNFFEPTILKGDPGQKLTIELKNEGEIAHTFTVSDQNVDEELQPDEEGEVEVTFPESGELAFVCTFHESSGMLGALEPSS